LNPNILNIRVTAFFKALGVIVVSGCIFFINIPERVFPMDAYEKDASDSGTFDKQRLKKDFQEDNDPFVHLYFADKKSFFLRSERIILNHPGNPVGFGKNIIKSLIKGPKQDLLGTIPENTKLRAFYLTRDGTAYVDMTKEIAKAHPGGINSEIITIYSIVNSLILNIYEVNAVKILINGGETLTLAGHIDISRPLRANLLLIR
jgi:spore germination protein GerM